MAKNNDTKRIHDREFSAALVEAVEISEAELEAEFIRLPSDLVYFGALAADAAHAAMLAEIAEDETEARVARETRETLSLDSVKKPTDAAVAAAVKVDREVLAAKRATAKAIAVKLEARSVLDAISAKRDMLMNLGAIKRREMDQDPTVREKRAGAETRWTDGESAAGD